LLERTEDHGARASYRAAILGADATFEGTATLGDDGSVELVIAGVTGELYDKLHMFAKLLARGAAKRRADGLTVWPPRVMRWRPLDGPDDGDDG
jgi:hypothetical protein